MPLLIDLEDVTLHLEWTIGTHCIQVSFTPPPGPSASDALATLLGCLASLPSITPLFVLSGPSHVVGDISTRGRARSGIGTYRCNRQCNSQGGLEQPHLGEPQKKHARAQVPETQVRRGLGRVCRVVRREVEQ